MNRYAFIFDDVCISPKRQIGLHSHSQWELTYIVCGAGTRTIGDLTETFTQGEIILIPPGIPHIWRFNPDETDIIGNIANISVFLESSLITAMRNLFPEMSHTFTSIESLVHAVSYKGERHQAVLRLLNHMRGMTAEKRLPVMMELLIAISDMTDSSYVGKAISLSRTEQRLEKVRVYCACNYPRQITLEEMSRYAGMNKSAFCTFMRHNTGMTFSEYLNNMRLKRAIDKLEHTDYSIAEISILCGFQNVTYFNRLFRKKYGCSPKEMRITVSE